MYIIEYTFEMFWIVDFLDHFNYVFFILFITHFHTPPVSAFPNVCLLLYYILWHIFSRVSQTFVLFIILSTIITIQVWRSNAIFEVVRELGHLFVRRVK